MQFNDLLIKRDSISDEPIDHENVKKQIRLKGYKSIAIFSNAVGISYSSLYNKINGNSAWTLSDARRVARFLSMTIDELFYKEDMNDNNQC